MADGPRGLWAWLVRLKRESDRHKLPLVAAGVAFFGLLALFPGIGAMMALAGLAVDPATVVDQMSVLGGVLPAEAADIVIGQARDVAGSQTEGLGLMAGVGILVTLYSASKGLQALMDGMNVIHEEDETRGLVRQTLVKLALTLGLLVGVLVCIGVAVVVPIVLAWLPLGGFTEAVGTVLRWPVLLVIAAAGIAMLYRYGPSHSGQNWRWIAPGAALACVMWLLGTLGFAIYVRWFGAYNETFGALGGVIILLMWLWLSAIVVLLGSLISAVLEKRDAAEG